MADFYTGTVQFAAALGDNKGSVTLSPTGNTIYNAAVSSVAGKAFTLTNAGTGTPTITGVVVTAAAAHGFTTGTVGLFWTDTSGVHQYAYGCTITAHDTLTVTVSIPIANMTAALPATSTAIIMSLVTTRTISCLGSTLRQILISSTQIGVFQLWSATPTSLVVAATPYAWPQAAGATVPFSTTAVTIDCYNGSISIASVVLSALQP